MIDRREATKSPLFIQKCRDPVVGRCLCAKTLCLILRIINRGTIKRVWYNGCTLAFHVNEDEFDSHYPLQLFSCSLAQLVEHSTDNRVVAGSSPARTTKDLMRLKLNWIEQWSSTP